MKSLPHMRLSIIRTRRGFAPEAGILHAWR
jgi:hypothetical protein